MISVMNQRHTTAVFYITHGAFINMWLHRAFNTKPNNANVTRYWDRVWNVIANYFLYQFDSQWGCVSAQYKPYTWAYTIAHKPTSDKRW